VSVGLVVPAAAVARPAAKTVKDTQLPWELADLRRLVRVLALSGTGLVVAWVVASGTTDPARQEYAVAAAVVGTALAVAGMAGWLLAGMRAVRRLRADELQDVQGLLARRSEVPGAPASPGGRVTGRGMSHHHDPTCLMVRGKAVRAARGKGLTPCPVCLSAEAQ
jgi:hypothetical protein